MAKEIKTITVKPNEDAQTIQNFQCFGWTLLSSQEVYNKDSHLEAWGKNTYSVTQTTHYVKLTFERDTAKLVNYSQIRRMEDAYMAVPYPKRNPAPKKEQFKWAMIFTDVIMSAFVILLKLITGEVGSGILFCALMAGMFYLMIKLYYRAAEKYESAIAKCWKKRNHIAQQAEKYL